MKNSQLANFNYSTFKKNNPTFFLLVPPGTENMVELVMLIQTKEAI